MGNLDAANSPVNIFISYSSRDKEIMEDLLAQLNVLKISNKLLYIWHDGLLEPGVKWNETIKEKLYSAQIVLMLISANFFNSEYILNIEIESTFEKEKLGELTAIPIIIKPCDWDSTPVGQFQALPRKGKPVSSFDNRDMALSLIIKELKPVIEHWQRKTIK